MRVSSGPAAYLPDALSLGDALASVQGRKLVDGVDAQGRLDPGAPPALPREHAARVRRSGRPLLHVLGRVLSSCLVRTCDGPGGLAPALQTTQPRLLGAID